MRRVGEVVGVGGVSSERCSAGLPHSASETAQTCLQDLPGIRNGCAWTVKPLLLSLIHVTQDNWHRSRGATVGDTEKEARSWG